VRVLNYGGGTNSTALAIEAANRGIPIDIVIFADTGSERPETYAYLETFDAWCRQHLGVPLTIVRWVRDRDSYTKKGDRYQVASKGEFLPLHEWCERLDTLPSRAFGMSGCTVKWKQQPVDKYVKAHPLVAAELEAGRRVERWIGYDADEPERADRMLTKNPDKDSWIWRAPLVEWDMGRDECVDSIWQAGLPSPGKSACWMCPASTLPDIDDLGRRHPELLERALRLERQAAESGNVTSRRGLGGRLNWNQYVRTGDSSRPESISCGCFDGVAPDGVALDGVALDGVAPDGD